MINLKRNGLTIDFDEEHGVVHSLCRKGKETIGEKTPVFKIILCTDAGIRIPVESMDMTFINMSEKEDSFICNYEDCGLSVKVSAQIDTDISWDISVKADSGYTVEKIDFPIINFL